MEHEERMTWIPCSERLPSEEKTFIVSGINPHSGKQYVGCAKRKKMKTKYSWAYRGYITVCMTHWMPLPLPPENTNE
jgi:hypothetical protein